jgi:O-antigen/teichoic acid export membrane protein
MRTSLQIAANALTSWGCSLLSGILGWMLVPMYLSQLGKEGYGLIGLATAILTYTMVADLGLREALGRQLAAEVARKDEDAFNRLASTAMVFYVCLAALIWVALAGAAPRLAGVFAVSAGSRADAVVLIRWYATSASFLTFVGSVYGATLTSGNRFDKLNIITSGVYALRAVMLILVLKLTETGIRGWVWVTLFTEVCRIILLRAAALRVKPMLTLRLGLFRMAAIRSLASLGIYYSGSQCARLLSAQSDPFVLSWYFGPAILVFYSPAAQLLNAVKPFVFSISNQLCPVATNCHVTNNRERLVDVLTTGTRYQLLQGAGAIAVVVGFSDAIMKVWLGSKLGLEFDLAANVLVALAFVDLVNFGGGTQYPVLLGMGRLGILVVTALPAGVVYIVTSFCLVGHTKLGVYGVLVPNLALSFLTRLVISAHAARLCGLTSRQYWAASYVRPCVVFALLWGFCLTVNKLFTPASYPVLAVCGIACFIFWVGLCWFVGFLRDDRRRVTEILQRGWFSFKNGKSGVSSAVGGSTGGCFAEKC